MEERTMDDEIGKTIVVKKRKDGSVVDVVDDVETAEDIIKEEENEVVEEVVFDMPKIDEDDEELADMTPEEAAEFIRAKEEEEEKRKARHDEMLALAVQAQENGDADKAEELYYNVIEFCPSSVAANVAYAKLATKDFSDYSNFDLVKKTYSDGAENAKDGFTNAIKIDCAQNIKAEIARRQKEIDELNKIVEEKKSARRTAFKADYAAKKKGAFAVYIPFVLFLVATVICALFITAVKGMTFLVLTVVFGAISFILLVLSLVASRKLTDASYRVKENERADSTKDGRKLLKMKADAKFLSDMLL